MSLKRRDFLTGLAAVGASSLIRRKPKARRKSRRNQNSITTSL